MIIYVPLVWEDIGEFKLECTEFGTVPCKSIFDLIERCFATTGGSVG